LPTFDLCLTDQFYRVTASQILRIVEAGLFTSQPFKVTVTVNASEIVTHTKCFTYNTINVSEK